MGCHPQTGFADIQGHPFFKNVDWDMVCKFWLFSKLRFIRILGQILLSQKNVGKLVYHSLNYLKPVSKVLFKKLLKQSV